MGNRWMLAAASIMALTTLVHIFAGGPESYAPLRGSELPPVARSVLSVVWHMVTIVLAGLAVGLFSLTLQANSALFWFILLMQLGFAALFLAYGLADFGSLFPMPQWIIFVGVPLLMLKSRGAS